jgi:hypothetical protein|tara:strand:- start:748 stop:996 length:249 start_codon:yes stop_codon:yes gene_type:complete
MIDFTKEELEEHLAFYIALTNYLKKFHYHIYCNAMDYAIKQDELKEEFYNLRKDDKDFATQYDDDEFDEWLNDYHPNINLNK